VVVVDPVAARAERQRVRGVDERLVDEPRRHREVDPRRAVVGEVGIAVLVDLARHRVPLLVAVVPGRRVAEVALDDQMAHGQHRVVLAVDDPEDGREDALGEVVHERVRPHVARGVGHEAVGEGEDLLPLGSRVARVGLRLPRLRQDQPQPLARLLGVDVRLPVDEIGEAVRPDHAAVVVRALVRQRGHDRRIDGVVLPVDCHLPVRHHVGPRLPARVDVRERLPRQRRRRRHTEDRRDDRDGHLEPAHCPNPLQRVAYVRSAWTRGRPYAAFTTFASGTSPQAAIRPRADDTTVFVRDAGSAGSIEGRHMTAAPAHVTGQRAPRRLVVFLLVVVVLLGAAVAVLVATRGSGTTSATSGVQGSGNAAAETRALPPFTAVELAGANNVDVHVGAKQSVTVHADDNLLDTVVTEVDDGALVVGTEGSFSARSPMRVEVVLPALDTVTLEGSGNIAVYDVHATDLSVAIPGSGRVTASGTTDRLDASVDGSGAAMLQGLGARDVTADVSGSGAIFVDVSGSLDATVSGTGAITYSGSPTHVTKDVTGVGAIVGG